MGILIPEATLLAQYIKRHEISGRALAYGKQAMFFNISRHLDIMRHTDFFDLKGGKLAVSNGQNNTEYLLSKIEDGTYKNNLKPLPHYRDEAWMSEHWISDDFFMESVGFNEYHTLDATNYENATFVYDLNQDNILDTVKEPYDLVLDTGTIEHVFNTRHCLKNIYDSLKVGGYIFHCAPANNHVDHGFYQFSPTFFHDYYVANNYNLIDIVLCARQKNHASSTDFPIFHSYQPGSLNHVSFGGLTDHIYVTVVLAQKTESSTWDTIPSQGTYEGLWKKKQS